VWASKIIELAFNQQVCCHSNRDNSEQNFFLISLLFWWLIHFALCIFNHKMRTHTLIRWNLVYMKGTLKYISVPLLVGIQRIMNNDLSHLNCKLQEEISWNLACRWSNHHRSTFFWFERNWDKYVQGRYDTKLKWC